MHDLQVLSFDAVGAVACSWPAGQVAQLLQVVPAPVENLPEPQTRHVRSVLVVPAPFCSWPAGHTVQGLQVARLLDVVKEPVATDVTRGCEVECVRPLERRRKGTRHGRALSTSLHLPRRLPQFVHWRLEVAVPAVETYLPALQLSQLEHDEALDEVVNFPEEQSTVGNVEDGWRG